MQHGVSLLTGKTQLVPAMSGHGVEVTSCQLDGDCDIAIDVALSILSSEERSRFRQFVFDRDRLRFARARGFLRQILAARISCAPEDVEFATEGNGKPVLAKNSLHFNISHSGNLAVFAIAPDHPVGVDLELVDRKLNPMELASSCFTQREIRVLRDEGEQRQRFFAFWTAKEAFMKLTAEGMSLDPRHIALELDNRGWPVGYDMPNYNPAHLRFIDLGHEGAVCCLATRSDETKISGSLEN